MLFFANVAIIWKIDMSLLWDLCRQKNFTKVCGLPIVRGQGKNTIGVQGAKDQEQNENWQKFSQNSHGSPFLHSKASHFAHKINDLYQLFLANTLSRRVAS
jgi:hypothetical protein